MQPFTDCIWLGIFDPWYWTCQLTIEKFVEWIPLTCHVNIVQGKDIGIANFEWTCHKYGWLSCDQYEWVWLNLKPCQCRSMHYNHLINHWLWPSTVQSKWWRHLPKVQASLLFWVGDLNHGLLVCTFNNHIANCTSVYQCDSEVWDDDNVGSMSHITFSHQDVTSLGETIW